MLVNLVEILELWHTKWTELGRSVLSKYGEKDVRNDPSTLGFVGQIVNIPPPSAGKVDFYPNAQLLDIAVRAHVLRFWE